MHPLVIFTNDAMKGHINRPNHPECPARLDVIMDMVRTDFADVPIETAYPINEDLLLLAHPQSHLDRILDAIPFEGWAQLDADTGASPQSYEAALISAGAAVQSMRAVMDNDAQTAFALARPPGHHAEYDKTMGFCYFANAFIAARASGVKTLIIDFDVHHGNGTEDLIKRYVAEGHDDIALISTHQGYGYWPDMGHENSENIYNFPLKAGTTSAEYRTLFTQSIVPIIKDFAPELVIFSAGFDAHEDDDISEINLSHDDYGWIVDQVRPLCPKIVSILEGGYNLTALPLSVNKHLQALAST